MRKLIIVLLICLLFTSFSFAETIDTSNIGDTLNLAVWQIINHVIDYESEIVTETDDYVFTTDCVNYRSRPSVNAKLLGSVEPGTELYRFGICRNGWSKVLISNIECYVSSDYITKEDPQPQAYSYEYSEYSPSDLMNLGVIYWGGWRFTWYSENVLPGGGLNIPGRWSDGNFVRDCDGYLCVASSDLSKGTTLDTPWGLAKVYDCGCANGTIDMYVSW